MALLLFHSILLLFQFLNLTLSITVFLFIYVVYNVVFIKLVLSNCLFLKESLFLVLIQIVIEFKFITNTYFLNSLFQSIYKLTIRLYQIPFDSININLKTVLFFCHYDFTHFISFVIIQKPLLTDIGGIEFLRTLTIQYILYSLYYFTTIIIRTRL